MRLRISLLVLLLSSGSVLTFAFQSAAPQIDAANSSYDPGSNKLVLKGSGFQTGATVSLGNTQGAIQHGKVKVKNSTRLTVAKVRAIDIQNGVDVVVANPDGGISISVHLSLDVTDEDSLSENDVRRVIAQAVAQAESSAVRATIAVTDREANVLGVFRMNGARTETVVGSGVDCPRSSDCGLEGLRVPATFAAISKAGTGAFLSSQGHAFTTRTASFIVQEHFPPRVDFTPGGPLFGVQFSQLPCSDINPALPLGLSADPGGVPLYKNGRLAGGVGIEVDGRYSLDPNPVDNDQPVEELIAVAATRGFDTPAEIRGSEIIVNGIRFPFVNTLQPASIQTRPFDQLPGTVDPSFPIRAAQPSRFREVRLGGLEGRVNDSFFPFRAGSALTRSEVEQIIIQAARQAFITRAAIRRPTGSPAEVNISVVDVDGTVLGIFSTPDAPMFGFDVCVQKARTASFFSGASAGTELRRAEGGKFSKYVTAAARDGIALNGSIAITDRANGFLSRPFFPDGIDDSEHGPFSKPIEEFSPFNDGLQLDLVLTALGNALGGVLTPCTAIEGLENGIQIFPGSVPLYKDGRLVGSIGISGDGVDQDDLIASMGSAGFEAPAELRSDRVFVRGVRLPYVKFPRHPNR